ncbi:type II and III secretion system protein [Thermocrinis ruber]|uniref:Type II and III secretion system protein n=1 Tax=Thermocrinis ruber TaxID=75906 RepID=W0DEH8_9AQUI|nr:pilus assembly protein [Thermocrinis ruber]AHE95443.1 type II and III secretion system protein [Thermocrinis ruber]
MKKLLLIILCALVNLAYATTLREMRFENTKLETVLKALFQVAELNVIFDPNISADLQKPVSVSVFKPMPIGEAINLILKEYGLIAVPVDTKVYRITKAGELTLSVGALGEDQVRKIVSFLKERVSPSAEIVIDRTLGTIYIRDEEARIKRLEPALRDFQRVAERIAPVEERITRVFYLKNIDVEEAYRLILPKIKKDTVITKVPTFNALVITDTPSQIEEYTKTLKSFLTETPRERRPITKIFYLKYISPEEFIRMIEPLRSEAGVILSGGGFKVETAPQQPQAVAGQQAQAQVQTAPTPILKEFNAVMITDYPEVIENIMDRFKEYISEEPVRIRIEARITEVSEEALRELGINWNALFSNAPVPQAWFGGVGSNVRAESPPPPWWPIPGLSPEPGGIAIFTYHKGMLNALNLRISALERIAAIKNIAKPSVLTINGQKATIKQGIQVPYQTAAVGAGGTAVPNIQFKDVVLQLDVTPIVSPDGRIMMEIELKRDTLGIQTPVGPAINTKEVKTKVIVEDGQTIVIGGVIDEQNNTTNEGIPRLVRVPLLKYLFGQERVNTRNSELLIFITPLLVRQ